MLRLLRQTLLTSALVLPIGVLAPGQAWAGKTNFWIYNNSEAAITDLRVSESSRDTWANNILEANNVLESGDRLQVTFRDSAASACLYDILAVFTDGEIVEEYQVNVCTSQGYAFYEADNSASRNSP